MPQGIMSQPFQDLYTEIANRNQPNGPQLEAYIDQWGRKAYRYAGQNPEPLLGNPPWTPPTTGVTTPKPPTVPGNTSSLDDPTKKSPWTGRDKSDARNRATDEKGVRNQLAEAARRNVNANPSIRDSLQVGLEAMTSPVTMGVKALGNMIAPETMQSIGMESALNKMANQPQIDAARMKQMQEEAARLHPRDPLRATAAFNAALSAERARMAEFGSSTKMHEALGKPGQAIAGNKQAAAVSGYSESRRQAARAAAAKSSGSSCGGGQGRNTTAEGRSAAEKERDAESGRNQRGV